MPDFLGIERLSLGPWQAFERAIQRLLVHAGFDGVQLVGGKGDEGADVVGELKGVTWVVQAKYRSSGQLVSARVIDEVTIAVDRYGGRVAVVATNSGFTAGAVAYAGKRAGDMGIPFYLWNGDALLERSRKLSLYPHGRHDPRPYQAEAIEAVNSDIMTGGSAGLVLMATGLGKTRVASGVVEQWLYDRPSNEVLLLSPSLALVPQLESSIWPYLPKTVATHALTGSEKPSFEGGITVATQQSMLKRGEEDRERYGLIIVDEAHHAPANGYRHLLAQLEPMYLLGMTATPWRGDERQLAEVFGDPLFTVSIVEGMQLGYLVDVDYRMLLDNIDWDWVHKNLKGMLSVKELNRRLFIPERDDAVVAKIRQHLDDLPDPRCVIFCRSIPHVEAITKFLKADGYKARAIHSKMNQKERTRVLHEFRIGAFPIIVTVDMLNEGIDIPDVNLIVFLRVTHSRRIFVQQLGRGLRLAEGKTVVRVLDFVSDVRRIAAGLDLNREAEDWVGRDESREVVRYPTGTIVSFEGDEALDFFHEYLADVAELEDDEQAKLKFPST
jgi:superfamily II DNA or RNA helicase